MLIFWAPLTTIQPSRVGDSELDADPNCPQCGRSEDDPFGYGEAGWAATAIFLRRIAKELIESRDPQQVNSGAKLISEAVRADRLKRDLKHDRLESSEVDRLEGMVKVLDGVRGHH